MSSELNESETPLVTGGPGKVYEIFEHAPYALEYIRFGEGAYPLICFHGYGRKAEDFAFLLPHLRSDVTLYCFNLFGHGRSHYPEDRIERSSISKSEWADIFETFLDAIGAEKAFIAGYSLGGKTALCLMEKLPERIEGVMLFAPDGMQGFPWYKWASRIPPVRRLIKRQVRRPSLLFATVRILYKLGFIKLRVKSFLEQHTRTGTQRKAVYKIWSMHRDLNPHISHILRNIQRYSIETHMILGRYDPVIRPERVDRAGMRDERQIHEHIVPKGHLLLDSDSITALKGGNGKNILSRILS